ncbi:branched-chain amino acid ABC transporter permease [Thermoflavimicrobium dichotomicum]|uniref:Branched-chain amino acid transport system permease protein n=1 Tax=Thermoflavimicrobium dichotomicum TaxID=46223 RepID=A0A1I3RYY7_9BACL|nr:branched-chain amino acid ABC transporter permease [Thermoflavimicrobium dichotomicum]SFJ51685.1 branched-chain amino acid transport system permease protein [Thermoflavimicrobium dichotomicum]
MKWEKKWIFGAMIALFLFVLPWIYDSRSTLILITQIFIFAVFAMSYDLLLGYTGIISFGHAMFFGIGAYSTGIGLMRNGETWTALLYALGITVILCLLLSHVVGMLSLRLKSHYYAMLTLAFTGLLQVGAEKWRSLTKGNDGFTFHIPEFLMDRKIFYLFSLLFMIIIFLFLYQLISSPFGKVLQAIRENERRALSLGYQVVHYKVWANVIAGVIAGLSGMVYALSLRFINTSVFAVDITLDVLLMTIIGGVGTLLGPIIGAALIETAHEMLTELADVHWLFERWIILFGLIYILVVLFFPKGIVGTWNEWMKKERWKKWNRLGL